MASPKPRTPRPPSAERLAQAQRVNAALAAAYPAAVCTLNHENALQLLIATILAAQCTDARVNQVTPALFRRFPDAAALASADSTELEELIRSAGTYRNKARAIREACAQLVARHGGQPPRTMEELTALRGVGRKTANVILGNCYGVPGLVVDTHVTRLSQRLGLTRQKDPVKIEAELMPLIPREDWVAFGHRMIEHGRRFCRAPKPACSGCPLDSVCPYKGKCYAAKA